MSKSNRAKSDDDFFDESMKFFLEQGERLNNICPNCVDQYNDHSLLKLIAITYWAGIFTPICHKGKNIGKLLDRKAGRIADLRNYL